ncbi:DsrE family protein [Thiomicrorhabdus lithotrophica]|uniref:DsrE family protein n=1 Tax=Thiomicrorhabdus lithotrophica TaxID=2949997 RepID=A0ABY8CCB4_9GAMM|nr:DsrE family protein [Thiomicrorhabdus lithotrophica]WEJ63614.1 DsrE family protein [Thiomicrorhabdus lithotrophica]
MKQLLITFTLITCSLFLSVGNAALSSELQENTYHDLINNPTHPQVEQIIQSNTEPEGVVFEIETLDSQALETLTDYVISQIRLIKRVYPAVDVAVISHGAEEFALQKSASSEFADVHNMFNNLVSTQGVSIHVCGAVGGLKQLTQEDFPDFVSYSASGLAQLNDYKALGYSVVVIKELNQRQRKQLFEKPERYIK